MSARYVPCYMLGRLANGQERDRGKLVHAVPGSVGRQDFHGRALCQAQPGSTSIGWQPAEGMQISCPRCLQRLRAAERRERRAAPRR